MASYHYRQLDLALADLHALLESSMYEHEDVMGYTQAIWEAADNLLDGPDRALYSLAPLLSEPNPLCAAHIAFCCMKLVKKNGDPGIVTTAFLQALKPILAGCIELAALCEACAPTKPANTTEWEALVERYTPRVAEDNPMQAQSWEALHLFGLAGIALLSKSRQGRKLARKDTLLHAAILQVAEINRWAGWLKELLNILDDEELLVFHPELKRGYRIRISGILDNYQLHILLAATLVGNPKEGWLPGERPDPTIISAAQGISSEDGLETHGVFTMVNWQGLQPNLNLLEGTDTTEHWIWHNDSPAHIEAFEGIRIVLLGRTPYERSLIIANPFTGLLADIEVLDKLSPAHVQAWLKRIAHQAQVSSQASSAITS